MRRSRSILMHVSVLVFFAMPVFVSAECSSNELCNPLSVSTISEFVAAALRALVVIALPIVTFFLVLAGFQYVTAQGNSTKISDAHRNFLYVVVGSALILGAWVLAKLIGGTVTQIIG